MLRKILALKVLLLIFVSICAAAGPVPQVLAAAKYPLIQEWQGVVYLTGKDGKKVQVKSKLPLQEQALFETSESSQIKVALDAERSFTVLANSSAMLPTISWEGGEAPLLILKSGTLRWQQKSKEHVTYNTALSSELFQFIPPVGDYIFEMNHPKAYAEVKVLSGAMEFSGLNAEESAQVKSGQQVGFQGMLEGKEIAYDVLLKGKKIPRGRLTPVTEITKKDLEGLGEVDKKAKQATHSKVKVGPKEEKREGAICAQPSGRFNECVWTCMGNPKKEKKNCLMDQPGVSCQRRRCNANGVWSEEMTVDAQKSGISCKAQPVVAPCDY